VDGRSGRRDGREQTVRCRGRGIGEPAHPADTEAVNLGIAGPVADADERPEFVGPGHREVPPQRAREVAGGLTRHGQRADQHDLGQAPQPLEDVGVPEVGADENEKVTTADRELAQDRPGPHPTRFLGIRPQAEIMTVDPQTVTEDTPIETALSMMRSNACRRLVVVDAAGRLVGILSFDDLLGLLAEEFTTISALLDRVAPQRRS
jgi:hypothetical protein